MNAKELLDVKYCAPTLANIKTASLFMVPYDSKNELGERVGKVNTKLSEKGIVVEILGYKKKRAHVFVYRPKLLSKDLNDVLACQYLKLYGYCPNDIQQCISNLKDRVSHTYGFPHEIGFFLGYPSCDVCDFIENKKRCLTIGCWKCFNNKEEATKTFKKYDICTSIYKKMVSNGMSIEKLIVNG